MLSNLARTLAKTRQFSTAPPATFARIISMKVPSKESGFTLDTTLAAYVETTLSKSPGYTSSNRFLCGGELDYKFTTKWEEVEGLKGFASGESKVVENLMKDSGLTVAGTLHTQNFMIKEF